MNLIANRIAGYLSASCMAALAALAALPVAGGIARAGERPKLILQITVDALRGDLPQRFSGVLGEGGFRYLMARRYGLRAGLDIARGPEDTVIYLAVGSNWN
jgi:hypothetical protein